MATISAIIFFFLLFFPPFVFPFFSSHFSVAERPYFLFGGSKTRLPSPEGERQMKSCSDQKAYLAKVDRSTHITKGVISVFWFWGSKNCLPSPKGGRQMKSCSDGKTCLAKVDRSAQVTIEKCPAFFYLGSVSWPWPCCRRCGVAGGERVPPAPLGWYSIKYQYKLEFALG